LALLKLVCWVDRHYAVPRKDAQDLQLILDNYLRCGNQERVFGEFVAWMEEEDFDYERAGARMLGHDIAMLLDDRGMERVAAVLAEQAEVQIPARLPAEMLPADPDRARMRLEAIRGGMLEAGPISQTRR
jgi:predicted nucleotidyltransferase